jgi:hypothetical protein
MSTKIRAALSIVFFVICLSGILYIIVTTSHITWTDQGYNIGPNKSIYVSKENEFYTKEPPFQILLKSNCNFVLIDKESNQITTSTFVPPQLGENKGSYIISTEINNSRYQTGLCGANIFSEENVVIFLKVPIDVKIMQTVLILLVGILAIMFIGAVVSWITV